MRWVSYLFQDQWRYILATEVVENRSHTEDISPLVSSQRDSESDWHLITVHWPRDEQRWTRRMSFRCNKYLHWQYNSYSSLSVVDTVSRSDRWSRSRSMLLSRVLSDYRSTMRDWTWKICCTEIAASYLNIFEVQGLSGLNRNARDVKIFFPRALSSPTQSTIRKHNLSNSEQTTKISPSSRVRSTWICWISSMYRTSVH